MSGVIYAIVPCLCNEVWGMSGVFCAVTCLCNEVWGMSGVIYVSLHKHRTITQITPDIHQTSLHKLRTITQITPDIHQTRYVRSDLCYCSCLFNEVWGMSEVFCAVPCLCYEVWGMTHKHGTITQITPEIPQTSLHKHLTITQTTADTPQTSRVYVVKFEVCQE
jgi:Na+-transporting methylmalonyl-CoA/oxaloacetate decarboxylase gamma subunit